MAHLSAPSACQTPLLLPLKSQVKLEGKSESGHQKQRKLSKCLVPPLVAAIVTLSPLCNPPASLGQGVDAHRGAALFNKACIGCHVGGGNIIQPVGFHLI